MAKLKPHKPTYEQLRTVWYKELERAGFKDIEHDEYKLKQYSSKFSQKVAIDSWESKTSYYSMARHFLHDHKFTTNLEKVIWEYHANGISYRNIAKTLKKLGTTSIRPNKDNVLEIVKRLEGIMKSMYLVGSNG